jgi:Hemerythrin HHE cation binding domain
MGADSRLFESPGAGLMNIFDRIKQDHDAAREVIAKLKATEPDDAKARTQLFNHLKIDMWAHHKIEEAVFYSYLRAGEAMHGEAMEAYNEHHMANGVFEELDTFPVNTEEWGMKFKALCELVEHHMKEEERDFFPEAKKVIPAEFAELMGQEFDRRKRVVVEALQPIEVKAEMERA